VADPMVQVDEKYLLAPAALVEQLDVTVFAPRLVGVPATHVALFYKYKMGVKSLHRLHRNINTLPHVDSRA
jgi:hypothetical protein